MGCTGRGLVAFFILLGLTYLPGCKKGIEGKYSDPASTLSVELKSGKASVRHTAFEGGFSRDDLPYEIDGDQILIKGADRIRFHNPNGAEWVPADLTLNIEKDGSLKKLQNGASEWEATLTRQK